MSLRVPIEALADSIPALRAAGVQRVEVGECDVAETHDTIPAPMTERPTTNADTIPADEPSSEQMAREFGWMTESALHAIERSGVIDEPWEPIESSFVAAGVARR